MSSCLFFFSIFQESDASIDFPRTIDIKEIRNVTAIAQIQNAKNFTSKIVIRGTPGFKYDDMNGLDRILNITRINPRSYSFLCTLNNDSNNVRWRKVLYEFGSRTESDVILHLQREFIDTKGKKSKRKYKFSFEDEQINISYVSVMADVSAEQ